MPRIGLPTSIKLRAAILAAPGADAAKALGSEAKGVARARTSPRDSGVTDTPLTCAFRVAPKEARRTRPSPRRGTARPFRRSRLRSVDRSSSHLDRIGGNAGVL